MTKKEKSLDLLGKVLLVMWLVMVVLIITFQMAGHLAEMPKVKSTEGMVKFIASLQPTKESLKNTTWVLHFIPSQCSCTGLLVESLITRGAHPELNEHIIFMGAQILKSQQLEKAGFTTSVFHGDRVNDQFGLEAGPVLAILDKGVAVSYVGGYFKNSAAKVSLDSQIIQRVISQKPTKALPIYGCPTSTPLKKTLDPFGLSAFGF